MTSALSFCVFVRAIRAVLHLCDEQRGSRTLSRPGSAAIKRKDTPLRRGTDTENRVAMTLCRFAANYKCRTIAQLLGARVSTVSTVVHQFRRNLCRLSVQPSRALADEKFNVLVQSAPRTQQLTLHALLHSEDGDDWEAFGHYVTDDAGNVNVSKDPSLGGTYAGVEPMGLLWSMRLVPGSRPGMRLRKRDTQTPMQVRLSVYQGHESEGFTDQAAQASMVVERWFMAPGVRRVVITEGGFTGTLFLPPGPGPFPGLLDLHGATLSVVEHRAALLASHGFASLAVDYLQKTHVKDEYLKAAYTVLEQHPQVCSSRIGLVGFCYGSMLALRMSLNCTGIQPRCLVCSSTTHVEPTVFVDENTRYAKEKQLSMKKHAVLRPRMLPFLNDRSKTMDVGQLQCPLLLIVGEDDQTSPSVEAADKMKQIMESTGKSHLLTVHTYPKTGHMIDLPYIPHTRNSIWRSISYRAIISVWGGETQPHSFAQEDAWRKTLDFLMEHLYRTTDMETNS